MIWKKKKKAVTSLPTRGAWIEIVIGLIWWTVLQVAPHAGSVD